MHFAKTLIVLTTALLSLAAVAQVATKPHHTADGFKNNYIGTVNKSFGELFRWQAERRQQGLPKPPEAPIPVTSPDKAFINTYKTRFAQNPAQSPAVTWIGHASTLVQAGGLNVLTDPMLSNRASPIQLIGPVREQPPGLALADLPPIDAVVISHNHYDHLDMPSVLAIAERSEAAGTPTLFMVPLGLKAWFVSLGLVNTVEFDWWEQLSLAGVRFTFTPTQHWSARGIGDRSRTLWGGWAVQAPDLHWYFAGDTGYSKDFTDTRQQIHGDAPGFDLALLPIGAYQPRWFLAEQHVDPAEAVQIHRDLNAKTSIGIHWGTFLLSDESADQPPKDLAIAAQSLAPGAFTVMAIGETRQLGRRTPREGCVPTIQCLEKATMTTPNTPPPTLPSIPPEASLIEYPSQFPIKVMGLKVDGFVAAITHVAHQFDPAFDATSIELRESSGGKYLGVTVTVTATSREQLDELYRTLSTHPMVKVVL